MTSCSIKCVSVLLALILLLSGCAMAEGAPDIPEIIIPGITPVAEIPDEDPGEIISATDWFQSSPLKKLVDAQLRNPYLAKSAAGSPEKPYIIVRESDESYYVIGSSLDRVTEESLETVRTVILCEDFYNRTFYTDESNHQIRGFSQGVRFYCLDAATGFYYCLQHGEPQLGGINPRALPSKTTDVPQYTISDEDVIRYAEEHYARWRSRNFTIPGQSGALGLVVDEYGIIYKMYENHASAYFYAGESGEEIVIPEEIREKAVTSIAGSFSASGITGVTFMCFSVDIWRHAFENCPDLKSVTFRCVDATLREGAFRGCKNLTTVDFGEAYITMEDYVFEECDQLEKITGAINIITMPQPKKQFSSWSPLVENHTVTDENGFEFLVLDDCAVLTACPRNTAGIETPAECLGLPVIQP